MKKLLVVLALSSWTFSVTAAPYIQVDFGGSNIDIDVKDSADEFGGAGGAKFDDNVASQRISLGYDFDRLRVAADYTNFGKVKHSMPLYSGNVDASVKFKSIGLSAFYDFKSDGAIAFGPANEFIPYMGLRLSHNKVDIDMDGYSAGYRVVSASGSDSNTGIGGMIGGQYFMTENFGVNVGVEYNRLFSDVNQYGAKVGVRYSF